MGNDWWRLDDKCEAAPAWYMWLCDKTPSRSVGNFNWRFDADLQGQLNVNNCSNGDFKPCSDIGRALHVGRNFSGALGIPLNPKITGPTGGFGWYLSLFAGSPRVSTFTAIQLNATDLLVIVLPYPNGTRFDLTWTGPSCTTCKLPTCLCNYTLTQAASAAEVRAGNGSTYFFDGHHLYFRLTNQVNAGSYIGIGGGKWGIPPATPVISREGLSITNKGSSAAKLTVTADCPPSASNPLYCDVDSSILPASPCGPNEVQTGFDTCTSLLPTPSATAAPSPSAEPTHSASASATHTGSGAASVTQSAAASPTASRSPAVAVASPSGSAVATRAGASAAVSPPASGTVGASPAAATGAAVSASVTPPAAASAGAASGSLPASPSSSSTAAASKAAPGSSFVRVEVSLRLDLVQAGGSLSAATRANVASAAVIEGAGAALCAAVAAAVRQRARFPDYSSAGLAAHPAVRCAGSLPLGKTATATTGGSGRRAQAIAAATTTDCDPLAYGAAAAGCILSGFDLGVAVTDTVPTGAAAAAPAAYGAAVAAAFADASGIKAAAQPLLAASAVSAAAVSTQSAATAASADVLAAVSGDLLSAGVLTATAPAQTAADTASAGTQAAATGSSAGGSGDMTQGAAIGTAAAAGCLLALVVAGGVILLSRRKGRRGEHIQQVSAAPASQRSRPTSVIRGITNPFSRSSKLALAASSRKVAGQALSPQPDVVVANPLSITHGPSSGAVGSNGDGALYLPGMAGVDDDQEANSLPLSSRGRKARVTAAFGRQSVAPVPVQLA